MSDKFMDTVLYQKDSCKRSIEKEVKFICDALLEKGYNPIDQLVGYLLSGDPTYITSHKDARTKIRAFERYELLEELVTNYISKYDKK